MLADFGLPDGQFIPALVSFNIGVEIGQLAIVAPLYILMRSLRPPARIYLMIIQIPASVVIASIGLYWTAERLVAHLNQHFCITIYGKCLSADKLAARTGRNKIWSARCWAVT